MWFSDIIGLKELSRLHYQKALPLILSNIFNLNLDCIPNETEYKIPRKLKTLFINKKQINSVIINFLIKQNCKSLHYIIPLNIQLDNEVFETIISNCYELRLLHIEHFYLKSNIQDEIINSYLEKLAGKLLSFSSPHSKNIKALSQNHPTLKTLKFTSTDYESISEIIHLTSLQNLNISIRSENMFERTQPKKNWILNSSSLRDVTISYILFSSLNPPTFGENLRLTSLKIYASRFDSHGWKTCFDSFVTTTLRHLSLTIFTLPISLYQSLFNPLTNNLIDVRLDVVKLSFECLKIILEHQNVSIQKMELYIPSNTPDCLLILFLRQFPRIETLMLNGIDNHTPLNCNDWLINICNSNLTINNKQETHHYLTMLTLKNLYDLTGDFLRSWKMPSLFYFSRTVKNRENQQVAKPWNLSHLFNASPILRIIQLNGPSSLFSLEQHLSAQTFGLFSLLQDCQSIKKTLQLSSELLHFSLPMEIKSILMDEIRNILQSLIQFSCINYNPLYTRELLNESEMELLANTIIQFCIYYIKFSLRRLEVTLYNVFLFIIIFFFLKKKRLMI